MSDLPYGFLSPTWPYVGPHGSILPDAKRILEDRERAATYGEFGELQGDTFDGRWPFRVDGTTYLLEYSYPHYSLWRIAADGVVTKVEDGEIREGEPVPDLLAQSTGMTNVRWKLLGRRREPASRDALLMFDAP